MKSGIVAVLAVAGMLAACGRAEDQAAHSAACMTEGLKAFERWRQSWAETYADGAIDPPRFHFNRRLNTCLMQIGHGSFPRMHGPNDEQHRDMREAEAVWDVYANKTVVETITDHAWSACGLTPTQGYRKIGPDDWQAVNACEGGIQLTTTNHRLSDSPKLKTLMTE